MSAEIFKPVFADYAPPIAKPTSLREDITSAYRRAEEECLAPLLDAATFDAETKGKIATTARKLIETLRAKKKGGGVEGLIHEYSLSSQEGIALMCLAEALLRIPDKATRDALIRDKITGGDWKSHIGGGRSLFVNAATWGLVVTGKLTSTVDTNTLSSSLTRLIQRCGEPVVRKGVDMAMRMMGEQFVRGQTIDEAVKRAKAVEEKGFRYSYDMLGEAATTEDDAERYYKDYETAIHAIGKAANGKGVYEGPGISIKLSALHPRYSRSQADRVMGELLPRVKKLALLSKQYNIGLNIDAEEADRLEISLDLLESLCFDNDLAGWNGIGFVVQAYGRRCPFVLDYVIDLARRSGHRMMVRLVKGAYWDSEIKRAQLDGLESYPVYTRKVYTDVSYIACATKLLNAPDAVFPQFATHNAQTLATIYNIAGPDYTNDKYEFQCLHGMGEPLYEEVVGNDKLKRPARIYAPVGTHETLLAYLVRRLLENGANSSFVHRIADMSVTVDEMIADPVDVVRAMPNPGSQNDALFSPEDMFAPSRKNSAGFDLSNEDVLSALSKDFLVSTAQKWVATPFGDKHSNEAKPVLNPADQRDVVGQVVEASLDEVKQSVERAANAVSTWHKVPTSERAAMLEKAADLLQERMPTLLALIAREAGKSIPNAIAEVREAIDFLRYYAAEARSTIGEKHLPLGPVVCISPWNFPLAIFTGQVCAALVAGNPVLAKPAEETPLIAAESVRILHEAGIPQDVVQLVPGEGNVGAALVASDKIAGVMFTGSTEVARLIQAELGTRLLPNGKPIPLLAETGGQNAMIVDSSALAEQVVFDVIASAFDSAGQRCSALRVLCLQEDVADRILEMLKGALNELRVGRTDTINVDVGPVISQEAKDNLNRHIETMRAMGNKIEQLPLGEATKFGTYVAPTIIELNAMSELKREVFGPVLHIIRYKRDNLHQLIDDINATGYGLTFGLHTRLDDTIADVISRVKVGNIYVNRNIIGAVVGSQPFGGRGLSGTGPKAGGALYLGRLLANQPEPNLPGATYSNAILTDFAVWLDGQNRKAEAGFARLISVKSRLGLDIELPGPVGETNRYLLHPRGKILIVPQSEAGLYRQIATVLATGNQVVIDAGSNLQKSLPNLPQSIFSQILWSDNWAADGAFAGVLIEGEGEFVTKTLKRIAGLPGPLLLTQAATLTQMEATDSAYCLDWLVEELSISVNTAAAGGNAKLMAIG
ncbi:trifunctional transcriptional regulator/proline dehydrogenase/L-glutamate gamma-semialdehyde dehydrogenase [Bartonella sp. HY761]|uniref:trifunctional transcriptional regulator/proline dehydrogenase/L-glutamate gamma-semialdehyde dehydrogenase n=1 Tax=Bartonella sp. HY761 TaxID=2979330 RepID=UPI00220B0CF5|nr:trifunctional transcriptional regulator/proline dehydrogenase/L-glutamate gamma-semialdehyde dehydrogenase [Bartonella sp. HY761]UXN05549.1 trifunctional transcriptional regulator/proline dehydrogenase/L-glutamate gamma-semialdehyde dehydrogenase [Bartonella sp. HY761]